MTVIEAMTERIEELREELVENRRYLHMHPETGFDVENTVRYVREFLKREQIEILPSEMGVLARIRSPHSDSQPMLGLRADMDALPLQETNDVPYRSQCDGKMHACGHDGHTAMLMEAGRVLNEFREELPCDVILLFQPAEEGPAEGGAIHMLEGLEQSGLADQIRAFAGLHLTTEYDAGTVMVRYGGAMASTDEFILHIKGKGGHASMPHETIDAISVGSKFVAEMERFMSRCVDPCDPAVFSVGVFQAGTSDNIVSETARLCGTLRCQSEKNRAHILEGAKRVAEGISVMTGAVCELELHRGLPVLVNDRQTMERAEEIAKELLGEEHVGRLEHANLGAEDFAHLAHRFPAAFLWIGARNEERELVNLMHNPGFDIDEDGLLVGAKLLCRLAAEL